MPINVSCSLNSNNFFQMVGEIQGFSGWFQSAILGTAIALEDCSGKTHYIDKAQFVKKFILPTGSPHAQNLATNAEIQKIVFQILQPTIGQPIAVDKIHRLARLSKKVLFAYSLKHSKTPEEATRVVLKELEEIKYSHLKRVKLNESRLVRILKPGDILFKRNPSGKFNQIVVAQKLRQKFAMGIKDAEGYKYSHVAMYLGNGKVAEASVSKRKGDEVRVVALRDSRFKLMKGYSYLVSRCADEKLAKKAVEVMKTVAKPVAPVGVEEGQRTPFSYSLFEAPRSIWHSSSFGLFAKYRYLKQYIDYKNKETPKDFMLAKSFFCSYLVGYAYQTAESQIVMPKILGEDDKPIKTYTALGSAIFRGLWARIRRWEHLGDMNRDVKMQFDAKRLSPQSFRSFIKEHPELFRDIAMIEPARS